MSDFNSFRPTISPTPWRCTETRHDGEPTTSGNAHEVTDANGDPVCDAYIGPDARLIVAAPDLLAACEAALGLEAYIDPANFDGHAAHAFKTLAAAVTKARGT